jgi:hypothetical protein
VSDILEQNSNTENVEDIDLNIQRFIQAFNKARTVILTAIVYLYPENWSARCSLADTKFDNTIWAFDILNENGEVHAQYLIDDIVAVLNTAREEATELLEKNPHYKDTKYLIGVGTERALQQFNVN